MRGSGIALALGACLLLVAASTVSAQEPAAVTKLRCRRGSCVNSHMLRFERDEPQHHRKLQQGWGGFAACGGKPLVIAHGSNTPTKIDDLVKDMESPLTKIDVTSRGGKEGKELFVDPNRVELVSLTDPSSCIRNLNIVNGGLVIYDDGSIPNLSALANIKTVVGPLYVYGKYNATLTNLDGLNNLQAVGGLNIAHTKLQYLNALANLRQIQGDFIIWDNQNLGSLEGIGTFDHLYNEVWIDSNPQMQDLMGMEALTTVFGDVEIRNMDNLASLRGLDSLTSVGGELALRNLNKLQSTAPLRNLTKVGISLTVVEAGALQDLAVFSQITAVPGDLMLSFLPSVPDLSALANLEVVGLNVIVSGNDKLQSLRGLDKLQSVGTVLSISNNQQLQNLQGLGSLQQVGQDLFIRGNPQLTTLADLPRSLRSIGAFRGGDVWIQNNARLATLSGLEKVPVYGFVTVEGNLELPSSESEALQKQAQPFPMTVEVLKNGLPSNVTLPAAAAAMAAPAATAATAPAAVPEANTTAAGSMVPAAVPAAAANAAVVNAAGAPVVPQASPRAPTPPTTSG